MKVMISGGGTGGHIFPAIAIANALRERIPESAIRFVGAKGKMEMEKVPAAGYEIEGLWISGLSRRSIIKNLLFPFKLVSSLWKSYRIIKKFRPDVVVGVGGFASGPLLEVACRLGKPTLIQEQNSYAGLTNKLLGKKVDRICVAFEGMDLFFPKEKLIELGNPVRSTLFENSYSQEEAKRQMGIPAQRKVILAIGGSLGARTINQMFRDNTELFRENEEVYFIWQQGKLYADEYGNCKSAKLNNVRAMTFIDDMAIAYTAADLVVSRAGALTLAELAALGKPAILIPSPNVAEDHQTKNALYLVNRNAALLVKDEDAVEKGIKIAIKTVKDQDVLTRLSLNIHGLERKNSAGRIADEIIKLAKTT